LYGIVGLLLLVHGASAAE